MVSLSWLSGPFSLTMTTPTCKHSPPTLGSFRPQGPGGLQGSHRGHPTDRPGLVPEVFEALRRRWVTPTPTPPKGSSKVHPWASPTPSHIEASSRGWTSLAGFQGRRGSPRPRVIDVLDDLTDLHWQLAPGERLYLFGTDVSDAFHQVPLHPEERPFTAASVSGRVYLF